MATGYVLVIAIGYWVIWQFYTGKNWARLLVLATSALALLELLAMPFLNRAGRFVVLCDAVVGALALYYLNTTSVREYFRGNR
jgi:hypothetical protein